MPTPQKLLGTIPDSTRTARDSVATAADSVEQLAVTEVIPTVQDKVLGWVDGFVNMLPNIVAALVILIAFWVLARIARGMLGRGLDKVSDNHQIASLLATIAYIAVLATGLFVALGVLQLEKTVTSLLAGVGIVGLALGFAFQDLAANFMAGVFMAVRHPFRAGEVIETHDIMGRVIDIDLRSTLIETFQGQRVQIPNKKVIETPLTNYSAVGYRRIDIPVGVSYGEDLEEVRRIAADALSKIEERDADRDPTVHFDGFGASSIDFTARMWIRYPGQDFFEARSQMIQQIKKAFDENDITIPFPIRTLDFSKVGGATLTEELPMETLVSSSQGSRGNGHGDSGNGSSKDRQA